MADITLTLPFRMPDGSPYDAQRYDWCRYYYFNNSYEETIKLGPWGVNSSFVSGVYIEEKIALQGNHPFLWREHYIRIVRIASKMGIDEFALPTASELKRKIELICSKNHYPPFSLITIYVWTEYNQGIRYAIFQSRRDKSVYDVHSGELRLMSSPENFVLTNIANDEMGINRSTEKILDSQAQMHGLDGSCVVNSYGKIVRTTLGNIYMIMRGGVVVGVDAESGGLNDPIDRTLQDIIGENGLNYQTCNGITSEMTRTAFECFVCSAAEGLRPVLSVGTSTRFRREIGYKLAAAMRDYFAIF